MLQMRFDKFRKVHSFQVVSSYAMLYDPPSVLTPLVKLYIHEERGVPYLAIISRFSCLTSTKSRKASESKRPRIPISAPTNPH